MNIHKNARTTPQSRAEIVRRVVRERQPARQVAAAFGISERTVRGRADRAAPTGRPDLSAMLRRFREMSRDEARNGEKPTGLHGGRLLKMALNVYDSTARGQNLRSDISVYSLN